MSDYQVMDVKAETRGAVYFTCRWKQHQAKMLMKVLKVNKPSPSDVARFNHEYDLIGKLDVEGVVKTYAAIRHERGFALIKDYFAGTPVKSMIEKEGPLDIRVFLDMAIQLAKALDGIHKQNLIHKGIRPRHILVNTRNGKVAFSDFGIDAILTRENDELFMVEVIRDHLPYISPEQTGRMNRTVDYRTDMYSLGATFYEMLTGKPPFQSDDTLDMIYAHIAREPEPPCRIRNDIPEALSGIVEKLLSKNAENRYQGALGLMADLETCEQLLEEHGDIAIFPLGHGDMAQGLRLHRTLYGRRQDIDRLMAAFDRVNPVITDDDKETPDVEILLVTGHAGVGKSVLIHEIHKPVTARRGYFISGKFQQFQRDTPYSAIIDAFKDLIRQILSENNERIESWKHEILDVLGSNAKIITDMIPDVELLIGPQPDVLKLGAKETKQRATEMFERFMGIFTQEDHPVTLFIDDLQWADRASLELIETILTRKNISHLFLIGSYRDNECDETHILTETLSRIESKRIPVNRIHLENLSVVDVNDLITDLFGCDRDHGKALAGLVHEKTSGNPFFVGEFLHRLYNESLIRVAPPKGWVWDMAAIRELGVTDNVVQLMSDKIGTLRENVQHTLKFCACMGSRFDLETIATVMDKPADEILGAFTNAEENGLIRMTDSGYMFIHDRIHEAAYSLIPDDEKPDMHYRIGNHLMLSVDGENLDHILFQVVDQLNLGASLITDKREQMTLAHLNLLCGKKAKASNAYAPASEYLNKGLSLLSENSWENQYNLTFALYKESIETESFLGNFDKMEQFTGKAIEMSRNIPDKALIYQIKIGACIAQERIDDALNAGFDFSTMANNLATGEPEEIKERYEKMNRLLEGKTDEDILNLPMMNDLVHLANMEVGSDIGYALYNLAPDILKSGVLSNICMSLEHGLAPQHPFNYCGLGLILITHFKDIERGYRFAKLAMKMAEMPFAKRYKARTICVYNIQVRHWKEHLKNTLEPFMEGYHLGIETGDHLYAADCLGIHDYHLFRLGTHFGDLEKTVETNCMKIKRLNLWPIYAQNCMLWQLLLNMAGDSDDPHTLSGKAFDADKEVGQWQDNKNSLQLGLYWYNVAMLNFMLDRPEQGLEATSALSCYLKSLSATLTSKDYVLMDAMFRLHACGGASPDERDHHLTVVDGHLETLKTWASHCEENSLHMYHLVCGERFRVLGEREQAVAAYHQALSLSRNHGYLIDEMMANERLFKFYLAEGNITQARAYLIETALCCQRLGARTKLKSLTSRYRELFDSMVFTEQEGIHGGETSMSNRIDVTSVLKASQVISGEVTLDRLLNSMMTIVMENAGATKGFTILDDQGALTVEAQGEMNQDSDQVYHAVPVEAHPGLSAAIVSYAARTREVVLLNDASRKGPFTRDPYVKKHQPKSILAYPIVNQNRLIGVLYLENAITTGAFTSQGVEVLGMLASQIAISITNARLYESLEEKVRKRTRELNESLSKVENANMLIMSSLNYAHKIQSSLLPALDRVDPDQVQGFVIWKPRDVVGGDIYHVEDLDGHMLVIVIDCTGHGVPGALMTMIASSGLKLIINGDREKNPAMILKKLNQFVKTSLGLDQDRSGTDDGLDAGVCCFDPGARRLTFAGARIPLYIMKNGEVRIVKADRQSLGYVSSDPNYTFANHTVDRVEDETFYLSTDGYMDQLGGSPSRRFGNKRFLNLLSTLYHMPFKEQKKLLLRTLASHKGNHDYTDDMTIAGFRFPFPGS